MDRKTLKVDDRLYFSDRQYTYDRPHYLSEDDHVEAEVEVVDLQRYAGPRYNFRGGLKEFYPHSTGRFVRVRRVTTGEELFTSARNLRGYYAETRASLEAIAKQTEDGLARQHAREQHAQDVAEALTGRLSRIVGSVRTRSDSITVTVYLNVDQAKTLAEELGD